MFRDADADALCEQCGSGNVCVRREYGELVSSPAGPCVGRTQLSTNDVGDLPERLAAGAVPVAIVDVLQSIEVEKEKAERLAVAFRTLDLRAQSLGESPCVEKRGECVRLGQLGKRVEIGRASCRERG